MDPAGVILVLALMFLGALALLIDTARHPYCAHCAHCRQQSWIKQSEAERKRQSRDVERHHDFHRVYGEQGCPWCEEERAK